MQKVYSRALKRAAEILGGEDALCEVLQVPSHRLHAWISGEETAAASRVVVTDVQSDPIFVGTDAARVMERAGVRAVQSTPLVGASD